MTHDLDSLPAHKQRKPQYAQTDEWIVDFLHIATVGHIATRWDDQPFITPSTFWYDEEKNEIYFHSNVKGRVRANVDRHPEVCFEASQEGQPLPSNVALNFSIQYSSVVAFGKVRVIEDEEESKRALYGLINKYFPSMKPGEEYRPITDNELARTSIYAIEIESWSGKKNWKDQAEQSDDWEPLPKELLAGSDSLEPWRNNG